MHTNPRFTDNKTGISDTKHLLYPQHHEQLYNQQVFHIGHSHHFLFLNQFFLINSLSGIDLQNVKTGR